MSQASAGGAANDAAVETGHASNDRAYRLRLAEEAERAVAVIEEKIAGMQRTLADTKAEAKRLRAEVGKDA